MNIGRAVTPKAFELSLTQSVIMLMRRVAGGISSYHAEDIVQDAAISAWLSCEAFSGVCDFNGWILKITRNTALNHKKAHTRYRSRVISDASDKPYRALEDIGCPFMHLIAERRLTGICDGLQAMKPATRNAFLLYRMTPAAYKDLPGTVATNKPRVCRATARLLEIE